MKTDRRPFPRPKYLIAIIGFILAGSLIILWIAAPKLLRTGGNTPMPYTIDTGTPEPNESSAGKTSGDYRVEVGLSEGKAAPQKPVLLPVATGEPLTPGEIDAIFARLPVLPVSPEEQTEFKYPVELLPPPRPGTTITEKFPPFEWAPTPETGPTGPLEVLRFAPEGEIPIAPFVSITFNQPMVPLGTLGDLAAGSVPAKIDPLLAGTWRWLGTKTLTFEYDSDLIDRLPKATAYTVTIPAGTKSATGGCLRKMSHGPSPLLRQKWWRCTL
jgi:hypothetical protein